MPRRTSRCRIALVASWLLASGAWGRPPDVPPQHWAAAAVARLVEAGLLAEPDAPYRGDDPVDRYRLAAQVAPLLVALGSPAAPPAAAQADLHALAADLELELAAVGVRVYQLGEERDALAATLDRLKMGRLPGPRGAGIWSGLLSVAMVGTGDGTGTTPSPGGFTPQRSRYLVPINTGFFTLPQASLGLDARVADHLDLHVQFDYQTDGASPTVPAGAGVGLNEAYLARAPRSGGTGWKLGAFALPFQSWEIDGPFRTPSRTITPSAVTSFFESFRVLGGELQRPLGSHGLVGRAGLFTGMDVANTPGIPFLFPGTMADSVGLLAVGRAASFDGEPGGYLELASPATQEGRLEWRLGWFDGGGDASVRVPRAASLEFEGLTLGLRWQRRKLEVLAQALWLDTHNGTPVTGQTDSDLGFLRVGYDLNHRDQVTVRYDFWQNQAGGPTPAGTEGYGLTMAFTRQVAPTARLALEWLHPDEEGLGPAPLAARDIEDDVLQARYTVWF